MTESEERIYLLEVAKALDRSLETVQGWMRVGILQPQLMPQRDDQELLYWMPDQIEEFRMWVNKGEKVYIREAASALNRRMATLRKWEQLEILPSHLTPQRGNRGWRYWTPEQIEGLREWLRDTDRRPGKGLPHYNPTEQQLDKAIKAMRQPHPRATASVPSTSGGIVEI